MKTGTNSATPRGHRLGFLVGALCALVLAGCQTTAPAKQDGALASWNDTPVRARILDFVARVTTPGSPDFVPPEDRLATFDMDGTVLTEKPTYTAIMISMLQACALRSKDPAQAAAYPIKQACAKDYAAFQDYKAVQVLRDVGAGQTQAQYRRYVANALRKDKHPRFDRPLGDMVYAPMIELATYLRDHGFRVSFFSGSTQPVVREVAALRFGSPLEDGVGIRWPLSFKLDTAGRPEFVWDKGPPITPLVDGPGKPLAILRHIGKPPLFAAGNTMGDFQMLQYATKGNRPGMGIVIVHDDPVREYRYTAPGIEPAARENGWTLVSMKEDFRTMFAD